MKVLKSRLYDLKLKEQQAKLDQLGGEKKDIALRQPDPQLRAAAVPDGQGPCARSYQVGDVNRVLDGDLDEFIKAYLMKKALGKLEAGTGEEGLS